MELNKIYANWNIQWDSASEDVKRNAAKHIGLKNKGGFLSRMGQKIINISFDNQTKRIKNIFLMHGITK